MRVYAIPVIFFIGLPCWAQENIQQQKQEQAFTAILALYNGENYQALIPAIHNYFRDYGLATGYQPDLRYFEAISAARLNQKDAEQRLSRFAEEFPTSSRVANSEFEMVSMLYRNKNYQRAIEKLNALDFKKLSKAQDLEGRFMLGYSYFNLKKLSDALDAFNFVKGTESAYSTAASYYAGYIEFSTGYYENALRDLQRIEKQSSYSAVVPYLIAQIYQKQGKDDEVIQYASSIANRPGIQNIEEINLLASEAYFRKKNYAKAIEGYNEYLKGKSTADRGVLFRAGFANFSSNKPKEAIEQFEKAASDKDSVGAYASYYLGVSYLKTNQKPLALLAFQVSRNFKKDVRLTEESSFQSAKLLYDLGRADEAIDEMEGFQKEYQQSSHGNEVSELLSAAYVNASSYHKAISHIEALSKRTPATDRAYQKATYLFGTEWYNKNDYTKAIEYFDKSLAFPFDNDLSAKAALWAGETHSAANEWEKAAAYYEKSLSFKPDVETASKVRFGLGYARYNQMQYDRALTSFREFVNTATKADPELANGYVRLADCFYVSKQYSEALANYKIAYGLNRSDQDYARLQAGVVSGILRKHPEALQEFDFVIKNYPQSPYWDEAIFQRAQLEFEAGNYSGAQAGYSKLISGKPASRFVPFAYGRRAAANYNLKDYKKTAGDYITLLDQYPNHPASKDILLPLQEALNLAGQAGEFDAYLAKIKKANPELKGLESVEFETSKNLYFNQDYAKAISSLTNFISSYPESSFITEAKYYRAECFYRQKDSQKALDGYREIFSNEKFAFANKVAGRVAELEFKLGRYEQAVEANKELGKLATTAKEKYASWGGLMDAYFLLNAYDSSLTYANKLLNDGGVSAAVQNRAALTSGKIAMGKGDYETAKDEFLTIVNNSPDEFGAEAKYRIAEIQFLSKAYKQSNETLFSLNKDYSSYATWVGKAFLLIAENYAAQGENFQAKATLKSLVDKFPLEAIKEEARVKLKSIEQMELSKEKVEKDSVDN
jgi:tetratricopeptide (TPR) repeat protein